MNELLERDGPATLVQCPWCDGPVALVPGSGTLACADCRLALELAPDEPTRGLSIEQAPMMRSQRRGAAWPALGLLTGS